MTNPIPPEALDELDRLYSAGYIVDCIIPQVTLLAIIDELREARKEQRHVEQAFIERDAALREVETLKRGFGRLFGPMQPGKSRAMDS